ncbi:GNAT family N-acetyltransferase [Nisaea acidiphila]|uniref:GNAT family N-acetyltransferase n=1 Tax=Nisaea acidiphila TaxID=1862145 RepID=A0A9J7ASN1_9PROT|nr:GNAT family N-acetyltransferase [Nisaea acidiphila]UUX48357.1 GNAT family N-acetyltransferase [Nisaea acidiphila]
MSEPVEAAELVFARFEANDLAEYQSWFTDGELSRRLSYPDERWFSYLGADHVACWAVKSGAGEMIAVVQADREPDGACFFDIALRPQLRGQGLGRKVLDAFISGPARAYRELRATVVPDNQASIAMVRRRGFRQGEAPDEDGFLQFSLTV